MKPTCADPTCTRSIVRQREGQWWCSWHPNQTAPNMDMLSGKIRDPKDPRKEAPRVTAVKKPRTHRTTRAPKPLETAPADGLCLQPGCHRPYRHGGRHGQPQAPREPITLGPCPTQGCRRLWPHTGKHALKPAALPAIHHRAVVDHEDAARRYSGGARLYDLSAELGIGVARLRRILQDQGVTIRNRGEVIDSSSRNPGKPLDTHTLELLYATGNDTRDVARHLGVKNIRVTEHLRQAGLLRPPANARATGYSDLRLRLEPGIYEAIQTHMTSLGHQYVTHYITELIHADLSCAGAWPTQPQPQEA
jgi:hypothetical protein